MDTTLARPPGFPPDVSHELNAEMQALSEADHRSSLSQRRISRMRLPRREKDLLLRKLAESVRRDRQEHVLKLAQLYQGAMVAKLFPVIAPCNELERTSFGTPGASAKERAGAHVL